MRTTIPVSPEAMRHLDVWVPRRLREAAWNAAYETYLRRAMTADGSYKHWAMERANRFWPIYISELPAHVGDM